MKEIFIVSVTLAAFGIISTFGLFWSGIRIWNMPQDVVRTLAFFALLCGINLTIYLMRSLGFLFSKHLPE